MPSAKRREPQEGDVVRIQIGPSQWLFGRVVSIRAHAITLLTNPWRLANPMNPPRRSP